MSTPPPDDVKSVPASDENADNLALDPKRWLALAVIALSQLMVILDATIVNIALPQAQAALGISDADRQWMVTAYALPFGALLLLGGRIADYVGRKKILIIALSGFAIASAVGGAAQVGWQLFIARAFQGAFAAMLAPAALSLVTVTFHAAKERAKAFAVFGAISGGGAAIGLLLGGVLTEYASWRWCLFVNIPVAIIAVLAAVPVLKESKVEGGTHYDIPGAVLATAGLGALVWACTQPAEHGWGSINTLGWLAVAVVLLAAFVLVELKSSSPLLPMRIVENRNRAGAYVVGLLVGAGLFAVFLFLTYYMQLVLRLHPDPGRLRVPAVQRRHHHRRGHRLAADHPGRPQVRGARRPVPGHGRDVLAVQDQRRDDLFRHDPLGPADHRGGDGLHLHVHHQRRAGRRQPRRRRRGERGRANLAAGRWLDRHRVAEHHRGHRDGRFLSARIRHRVRLRKPSWRRRTRRPCTASASRSCGRR